MAELVDAPDSKSGAFGRPGSTPGLGTLLSFPKSDTNFDNSKVANFQVGVSDAANLGLNVGAVYRIDLIATVSLSKCVFMIF